MANTNPVDISRYGYIFDQRRGTHPWECAVEQLLRSDVPGYSQLAANWRMDPRVDSNREENLIASGCFPSTKYSPDFVKAICDYFSYRQCRHLNVAPGPGYASDANSINLITANNRPSRNHHLLHFASLNSLLKRILRADNQNRIDFQLQLSSLTGERPIITVSLAEISRLADRLNIMGTDTVKSFARIVSDALGKNEPHWWAAFAHEIGEFSTKEDWTETVRILGLGHLEVGERLLAWRYSPEKIGRLFRPTVAEARDSGFHFPSPQSALYGITMPLSGGLTTVRELVHSPLKGDVCADACTGMIGRIMTPPVPVEHPNLSVWFKKRRAQHRACLRRQNPTGSAQKWLERHADLP